MSKRLRQLKSILRVSLSKLDPEESRASEWRKDVIQSHQDTSALAANVLKESRSSRLRLERSWDEAKSVINAWNSYENRYQDAINKLHNRITEFEAKEKEKENELLTINKVEFYKPSEIASMKRNMKFTPKSTNRKV